MYIVQMSAGKQKGAPLWDAFDKYFLQRGNDLQRVKTA
jgi:hypothetical protein